MSLTPDNSRLIIYYSGVISALTLFTQYEDGSVCSPKPLPLLSSLLDTPEKGEQETASDYENLLADTIKALKLPEDMLKSVAGFRERVETPKGVVNVYLARIDLLDPPHKIMSDRNCQLKGLLDLYGNSTGVEMELLRKAYGFILES